MKKVLFITIAIIFLGTILIMTAPPGEDIYDAYTNQFISSKENFRSRKSFEVEQEMNVARGDKASGASSSGGSSSGAYEEKVLPDDLSKENLQAWLDSLSISPERRKIIQWMIDVMGTIPYVYGGQGRTLYRNDPSTWPDGTDCSGMVCSAYFRGGIDFGWCYDTSSLYSTFRANAVTDPKPGDISVYPGHTELWLGKQANGNVVHFGIRTKNEPPGPSTVINHGGFLYKPEAIIFRHPQLQAFDDAYYTSQSSFSGGSDASGANSGHSASEYASGDGGVTQVLPEVKKLEEEFLKKCAEQGLDVKIVCDIRTVAEQNELYAQGRTKGGSIVTRANGSEYQSYHQWGLAFDFCHKTQGYEPSDPEFWSKVGAVGKSIGLEWGGDWTSFVDRPHLQLSKYGGNVGELKQKYGSPENMYKQILGE